MAESTSVALAAAPIPSSADIARAEKLVRERFLHDGEDAAVALAPGTPRRRALDLALAELAADPKAKPLDRLAARVLAAARPRAGALRGGAEARRRHGALRAPGRRALGHADRAARRGAAHGAERQRRAARRPRPSCSPRPTSSAPTSADGSRARRRRRRAAPAQRHADAVEDEEDDEEDEDEDERRATTTSARCSAPRRTRTTTTTTRSRGARTRRRPSDEAEQETESEEEPRDWVEDEDEEEALGEQPEDPNAAKRFWFEHATGAGKTVAALGFVEASQTGGVLILTHRRNLVDQFLGELRDRGYSKRISRPLLKGEDSVNGPVTVETYQWFVRNAGKISSAYTIVICDEAHTALGEKTSAAIREWTGPIFIGMTATGALIARHVTDLFPTQTSRFDLAQAARRGVISPLRCVRISPGRRRAHDRQGAAAPRRGRHRVRPGRARQTARPAAVQPGRREPLQDALQRRPGRRLRGRRAPRLQPRRSVPRRGHEGAGGLGRDAQARARRDPRALRARRHRRADQRAAARRGLEQPARDRLRAPRADRLQAHLPAARRARHAPPSRQGGRASSSTSCTRRPSTTTRS